MCNFIAQQSDQTVMDLQNMSMSQKVSDGLTAPAAYIKASQETIKVLGEYANSRWVGNDVNMKLVLANLQNKTSFASSKIEEIAFGVLPPVQAPVAAPVKSDSRSYPAQGAFNAFTFERRSNGKLYFSANFTPHDERARVALEKFGLKMKANGSSKMAKGVFHTKDNARQKALLEVAIKAGAIRPDQKAEIEAKINQG